MAKPIPAILRDHSNFTEWFAAVLAEVNAYGDKRAEFAILTGLKSARCSGIVDEAYAEAASEIMMDATMHLAGLRDLIGGTVKL